MSITLRLTRERFVDPDVDDARLLTRNRLYQAAWPYARDIAPGDTATRARRFAEFRDWARSNGFNEIGENELEWAFHRAEFDSTW